MTWLGFHQGDALKIVDDLQSLRPTLFVSVPRLYNRIYDKITSGARDKGGLAAFLFQKALSAKLDGLRASGAVTHGFWDALVFKKVQAQLGLDRCNIMITGAAPIAGEVKDFMRVACGVNFLEGCDATPPPRPRPASRGRRPVLPGPRPLPPLARPLTPPSTPPQLRPQRDDRDGLDLPPGGLE